MTLKLYRYINLADKEATQLYGRGLTLSDDDYLGGNRGLISVVLFDEGTDTPIIILESTPYSVSIEPHS